LRETEKLNTPCWVSPTGASYQLSVKRFDFNMRFGRDRAGSQPNSAIRRGPVLTTSKHALTAAHLVFGVGKCLTFYRKKWNALHGNRHKRDCGWLFVSTASCPGGKAR
jgi:hypothetical protein